MGVVAIAHPLVCHKIGLLHSSESGQVSTGAHKTKTDNANSNSHRKSSLFFWLPRNHNTPEAPITFCTTRSGVSFA